ncbi:MAG: methyl-accepting chemotaxis protein [Lachnospiraceae bacterium]|nr:methyl-accepting chemotaxis protein [Lachnospiraceae bacterium]
MTKNKTKQPTHNRRSTLSTQLTIRIVLFVAVSVVIMTVYSIYTIQNSITELSMTALTDETESCVNSLDGWIDSRLCFMEAVATTVKTTKFADDAALLKYFEAEIANEQGGTSDIYIGSKDGRFVDGTGWVPKEGFDPTERDWYKFGQGNDSMAVGATYHDGVTDGLMVPIAAKIDADTVLSGDISLNTITSQISSMNVMDNGYAFLIEKSTGTILAHANKDYIEKKISEENDSFLSEVASHYEEQLTPFLISDKGTDYYVMLQSVDKTDWILVTCANKVVITSRLNAARIRLIIVDVIVLVLLVLFCIFLIRHATKPIAGLTKIITKITDGDFSQEASVTGNNEITTMSEALNRFISTMHHTIRNLTDISNNLSEESKITSDASTEINSSAEVQLEASRQLNTAVSDVSASIEEIANNATELATTISIVSQNSTDSKEQMKGAVVAVNNGHDNIEAVSSKMKQINNTILELEKDVSTVGESMTEINNITDIIGDISSQTNLLALNASIEAARAGEAGKGFAVVATEIGNLANMSSEATMQITDLIQKISQQVKLSIERTEATVSDIQESNVQVEETNKNFREISNLVSKTMVSIDTVTSKINALDNVATSMAAVTQEQSASTEEMLATAEDLYEQSAAVAERCSNVMDTAHHLNDYAEQMNEKMQQFCL